MNTRPVPGEGGRRVMWVRAGVSADERRHCVNARVWLVCTCVCVVVCRWQKEIKSETVQAVENQDKTEVGSFFF